MNCLSILFAHHHSDVAGALEDPVRAALGARTNAVVARALVDEDLGDLQLIDIGAGIVLGVGDRRLEHLLEQLRRLLVAERQQIEGAVDRQPTHLVGDQTAFLRRNARVSYCCRCFHRSCLCYFVFFAPAWPRKVRVIANSPSLCPTMFSDARMGMCCLPLCTASVTPTICGSTVERRDQVLKGLRLLVATASSTVKKRCRAKK